MTTYYIVTKSTVFYIDIDSNQFFMQEVADNLMLDRGYTYSQFSYTLSDPNRSKMIDLTNYYNDVVNNK